MTGIGNGIATWRPGMSGRPRFAGMCARGVLLTLLLAAGLMGPRAWGQDSETVRLHLKWFHQFQFAGYYAAVEQGYYADEGLDVVLLERNPEVAHTAPVLSGAAEYGVSDAGLYLERVQGAPVVLLAQIFQHSPHVFISLRDSGIVSPFEMADKRVMVDAGNLEHAPLLAALRTALGSTPNFTYVPQTFTVDALINGDVDVLDAYLSNEPFELRERGVEINVISPRSYGIDFYGDNLFTTESEVVQHPERVRKMVRASLRGWEYALDHPDEIIDLIQAQYNTQGLSRAHLEFEARQTAGLVSREFIPLGSVLEARYRLIGESYSELGYGAPDSVAQGFIFEPNPVAQVSLTEEEAAYVAAHPVMRAANEMDWPPFDFFEGGVPRGYGVDYLRAVSEKVGLQVEFVNGYSWAELVALFREGELDLLPVVAKTPEREGVMLFTRDYLANPPAIVVRQHENAIDELDDLSGKRLAAVSGYNYEEIIRSEYPAIEVVSYDGVLSCLTAVQDGIVDAFVGSREVIYYTIEKHFLRGLRIAGEPDFGRTEVYKIHMAAQPDNAMLVQILEKGMAALTPEENRAISRRWLSNGQLRPNITAPSTAIAFTDEEEAWLSQHPVIRFTGDPDWMPQESFTAEGDYVGIAADMLDLLEERIGVRFERIPVSTWTEAVAMVSSGDVDVLSETVNSDREGIRFTRSYLEFPVVFFGRKREPIPPDPDDWSDERVGVVNDYGYIYPFRDRYPDLNYVVVDTVRDGLLLLASGEIDVFIESVSSGSHAVSELGLTNVAVSGYTDIALGLGFGVQAGDPVLASIMDKGLATITAAEKSAIRAKWVAPVPRAIDEISRERVNLARMLGQIAAAFAVFLLAGWLAVRLAGRYLPAGIQSRGSRTLAVVALASFLTIAIAAYLIGLRLIGARERDELAARLQATVNTTHGSILTWLSYEQELLTRIAHDPEFREIVRNLADVQRDREALLQSSALERFRTYLAGQSHLLRDQRLVIVGPDLTTLGSLRDDPVGRRSEIVEQRPLALQPVFEGEPTFVLPVRSTVPEPDERGQMREGVPVTYVAAPIVGDDGTVVAAALLRMGAARTLSQLCQAGRMGAAGDSAETYAFDASGTLLTESRFRDNLVEMGLLPEGEMEVLTLRIADPGGHLGGGYRPGVPASEYPLTEMARQATSGHSGVNVQGYRDYRGVPVAGAWIWDSELQFGLASEVNISDAMAVHAGYRRMTFGLLAASVFLALLLTSFALWTGERVNRSLRKARDDWERVAEERTSELRRSEERFRAIFDQSVQLMGVLDNEGVMLDANRRARDIVRAGDEAAIHGPFWDGPWWRHSRALQVQVCDAVQQARQGTFVQFEVTSMSQGGDVRTIDLTLSPVKNNEGEIEFLVAMGHDISDLRNAEQVARRYEFIANSNLDMMALLNDRCVYEAVNDAWCEAMNCERRACVGKTVSDVWGDEVFESAIRPLVERCLQGESVSISGWMSLPKSGQRYCEVTYYPYFGGGETVTHIAVVTRDVTDRQQAEEELEERRRTILTFVDTSPGVIVMKDTDGRHLLVNKYYEQAVGVAVDEVLGKTDRELFSDEMAERTVAVDRFVMESRQPQTYEEEVRHPDGTYHAYTTTKVPLVDDDGHVFGIVGLSTDITERKALEAELTAARITADDANRAKSDFLATMSHEIRTPMNAVIGLAHLALKTELNYQQADYLEKILSSANALLGIINDILDFSKIEAGRLDLEQVDFDLDGVLDNLSNVVSVRALEKPDIEILFDVPPAVPRQLRGDPLRLGQVLVNIATNAVKFTEHGDIVIGARTTKESADSVSIRFQVQDSGIGMSEEQLSRLFTPFTQADSSTTRKYGGTGLGLTISQRICEIMGGKISVESAPGEGSTFSFELTFGKAWQELESEAPKAKIENLRVLVVDDNPVSRRILESILDSFGYRVSCVASAEEAMAELEAAGTEHKFDLVLMDWKLPGMSGIEASVQIKSDPEMEETPFVILVTAYGRELVAQQADAHNLDAVLLKPITPSTLFDSIISIFGDDAGKHRREVDSSALEEEVKRSYYGAQVLLVEDNDINQQVATELLERAGMVVDVANHGEEALSKLSQDSYSLVFMDCQMPVMDGYTATAAIRSDLGLSDVPIIAMTANSMAGDRDKCLAAGMNDYVAKPIDPAALYQVLLDWLGPEDGRTMEGPEATRPREAGPVPDLDGIDTQAGLVRVGGNATLYRSLLRKLATDYGASADRVGELVNDGNLDEAVRLAHSVKGVAGNLGAEGLQDAAERLERALQEGNGDIGEALNGFRGALSPAVTVITAALSEEAPASVVGSESAGLPEAEAAALLRELSENLEKKKPKPCKEALARLGGYGWQSGDRAKLEEARRALGRYRFAETKAIVDGLLMEIGFEGEAE